MTQLEEDATVMFGVGPDFPRDDVGKIAARLAASNSLVPGFLAPPAGLVSLEALLYAELIDGTGTVVLIDRNIASRMAQIARDGAIRPLNKPSQVAVDLMALSQAMNLDLEPGLAFHELAETHGNDVALEELRWFRAADHGQAHAWIDVALDRSNRLATITPGELEKRDLTIPIHRWRCNYAVMLKAATLQRTAMKPLDRATRLLDWMVSDFIVAGPAAMFCAMFFSPYAAQGGLVKGVHSPDRSRALAGARNAAWDVTYLSELVRRARSDTYESKRHILATADRALAEIAPLLFIDAEDADAFELELGRALEPWWRHDAPALAQAFAEAMDAGARRPAPEAAAGVEDYVGDLIAIGEAAIAG